MKSSVSKWGNSLGLRIPRTFVDEMGIGDGTQVEIQLKNGSLIISPLDTDLNHMKSFVKSINIDSMVKKINKKNRPNFEDDQAQGQEVW